MSTALAILAVVLGLFCATLGIAGRFWRRSTKTKFRSCPHCHEIVVRPSPERNSYAVPMCPTCFGVLAADLNTPVATFIDRKLGDGS